MAKMVATRAQKGDAKVVISRRQIELRTWNSNESWMMMPLSSHCEGFAEFDVVIENAHHDLWVFAAKTFVRRFSCLS